VLLEIQIATVTVIYSFVVSHRVYTEPTAIQSRMLKINLWRQKFPLNRGNGFLRFDSNWYFPFLSCCIYERTCTYITEKGPLIR